MTLIERVNIPLGLISPSIDTCHRPDSKTLVKSLLHGMQQTVILVDGIGTFSPRIWSVLLLFWNNYCHVTYFRITVVLLVVLVEIIFH